MRPHQCLQRKGHRHPAVLLCRARKGVRRLPGDLRRPGAADPGDLGEYQANSRLYEVRTPAAPTAYVECEFHDNPETARWIIQHTDEIGEAIARGLCQYLGVAYAPAQAEKPAPQPKGDGLFRVQVGAFANRNNAEKMLERLKKAGFSGFISSEK